MGDFRLEFFSKKPKEYDYDTDFENEFTSDEKCLDVSTFECSNREISTLPSCITKMTRMDICDFSNNEFDCLPDNFENLKILRLLSLEKNYYIQEFPLCICFMTSLKILDVSECRITELPESIGSLINLIDLKMSRNRIMKLPDSIGQLCNLETLYITSNFIMQLPETIEGMKSLEELEMEDNPLITLPSQLSLLPKLTEVYFNDLDIEVYPLSLRTKLIEWNYDVEEKKFIE